MSIKRNLALAMAFALALGGAGGAFAQAAPAATNSDDELFGAEEVTTEAAPQAAAPEKAFLKYDQVKLGGSITGKLGVTGTWVDPWTSFTLKPTDYSLDPSLSSKLTITAKPSTDFGVNLDFRMSYPFSQSKTVASGVAIDNPITTDVDERLTTVSVPNISVWAAYAKFSLGDNLFMSFGKQPVAWGVSKGFFQPADDIFATSNVDYADTSAEREGPLAFKAMYPIPLTMTSFYFYAGLPYTSDPKPEDLRLGLKAEINAGNTELALAGFYGFNDHPRAVLMATTGTGSFNFFGEAILKYGSERYFVTSTTTGAQESGKFYFSSTLGGYYTDSDKNITLLGQVYYNGEGQTGVSAKDAYTYYYTHSDNIDRMKFSPWYAGLSFSKDKLFVDDLSVGCYAVANLSDLSAMVVPSATWAFSDYMKVALSATFTLGESGDEFLLSGAQYSAAAQTSPLAALSLTFTLGSGSF